MNAHVTYESAAPPSGTVFSVNLFLQRSPDMDTRVVAVDPYAP